MLVNCIVCGRLFNGVDDNICNRCIDDEESPYVRVREYLYLNSGASAVEVSVATGVSVSSIMKFIKDNRITLVGEKSLFSRCNTCGEYINQGSMCSHCMEKEKSKNGVLKITSDLSRNSKFGNRSRRR